MAEVKHLVTGDALRTESNKRSKPYDEHTVTGTSETSIAKKVSGYVAEGWEFTARARPRLGSKNQERGPAARGRGVVHAPRHGLQDHERRTSVRHPAANSTDPRQIDVYAKDDETVLIVECTHSRDAGPKSLKVLPDKIHAIQQDVIRFVHDAHGKDPKLKIEFAIATRNVEWRPADRERAKGAQIAMITEVDLAYHRKLTDLLREAARFQFPGRYLNNQRIEDLRDVLHATRGHAGGRVFYSSLISSWELMKLSYVHHKSKTSDESVDSYQRMVKPSRLKRTGEYLDGGGKFPTNIVINFKFAAPLRFDTSADVGEMQVGSLTLPGQYGSAWTIDGQHRLYGYAHSDLDPASDRSVINVLAYENLPVRDEIRLFVDIDTEQVKVSRNLVGEILSGLDIEDDDAHRRLDALHARIGFPDETATATNMERRYGRAPRGERCRIAVPHGHDKTTIVTATLRASGPFAIDLMDGATTGTRFLCYVTGTLVPALKPGDTVVMDNLAAHKVTGIRQAIEAAGAKLLYLAAYSPDFNPIEPAFAKLKTLLRTAAARTVPDLWAAIRDAFTRFKPDECRNTSPLEATMHGTQPERQQL